MSETWTTWLFLQSYKFDIANLYHQMSIRQNQVHCQIVHSICYHLSFIYEAHLPALILWNYLKDNDTLTISSKSHVRHSKTMSPNVDTTKPSTLLGSPFNLLSSELYLLGWLSRLNPLNLFQRQWPLDFFSTSHIRHSKTMSPDVDTTKPSTLPGSPFNFWSSEFYLWGWPSRLNPLKLSQRQRQLLSWTKSLLRKTV